MMLYINYTPTLKTESRELTCTEQTWLVCSSELFLGAYLYNSSSHKNSVDLGFAALNPQHL